VRSVVVSSAAGKAEPEPRYSLGFSLMAMAGPGILFKLLLADQATLAEVEAATESFQEFLAEYYDGRLALDEAARRRLESLLPGRLVLFGA
jgi:hypothetical protein